MPIKPAIHLNQRHLITLLPSDRIDLDQPAGWQVQHAYGLRKTPNSLIRRIARPVDGTEAAFIGDEDAVRRRQLRDRAEISGRHRRLERPVHGGAAYIW